MIREIDVNVFVETPIPTRDSKPTHVKLHVSEIKEKFVEVQIITLSIKFRKKNFFNLIIIKI